MPTFAVPNRPDHRREGGCSAVRGRTTSGFTLVELMVVLAVMGLLAGVAVWRWPGSDSRVRSDAVALSSRVAAARDEAIITGRPLALDVDTSGYRFLRRGDEGWQPTAEPALAERRWSRGVRLASQDGNSRVGFDSVGLPDRAAAITLAGSEARAVVEIAADGEVSVR